jgi:WD40 repeat protein
MTPEGKRTGRAVRTLEGHSAGVCDVAVTLGGKRAVSASAENNTLRVWDLYTGLPIAAFRCDAPAWWCAFAWRLSFESCCLPCTTFSVPPGASFRTVHRLVGGRDERMTTCWTTKDCSTSCKVLSRHSGKGGE